MYLKKQKLARPDPKNRKRGNGADMREHTASPCCMQTG